MRVHVPVQTRNERSTFYLKKLKEICFLIGGWQRQENVCTNFSEELKERSSSTYESIRVHGLKINGLLNAEKNHLFQLHRQKDRAPPHLFTANGKYNHEINFCAIYHVCCLLFAFFNVKSLIFMFIMSMIKSA